MSTQVMQMKPLAQQTTKEQQVEALLAEMERNGLAERIRDGVAALERAEQALFWLKAEARQLYPASPAVVKKQVLMQLIKDGVFSVSNPLRRG